MSLKITREQLYREVWEHSLVELAKKYPLSGNSLGKLCKSREIPTPPIGFWASKNREKFVRPELPEVSSYLEVIILDDAKTKTEYIKSNDVNIIPTTRKSKVHPLIEQTKEYFLEDDKPYNERKKPLAELPHLDIRVSKKVRVRALKIMSTLITALEARGHVIKIDDRERENTFSFFKGEKLRFGLQELDRTEYKQNKYYNERIYVPTGKLQLTCFSAYRPYRQIWKDGAKQRVENCLSDFIVNLEELAEARRLRTIEYAESEARSELARQKREEEENRIKALESNVLKFQKVKAIREYLVSFENVVKDKDEFAEWLSWAHDYANKLDPLYPATNINKDLTAEN